MTKTYEPNALQKIQSIYDPGNSSRTFEYGLTGQIIDSDYDASMGRVQYWYDDRGNLIKQTGVGQEKLYSYDISGKPESFIVKILGEEQYKMTYSYNKLELLSSAYRNGVFSNGYNYDENGNLSTTYGYSMDTYYSYNRDNSLESIFAMSISGLSDSGCSYEYYLDGSIKNETVDDVTKTYVYDTRGMLASESWSDGDSIVYIYDGSGNRTKKITYSESGNTSQHYVYNNSNQLTREYTTVGNSSSATDNIYYTYDNNGNMVQRSRGGVVDTFNYNGYNELVAAVVNGTTSTYTYFADGLRRTKSVGDIETKHIYDGEDIVMDLNSDYSTRYEYIRGLNLMGIYDGEDVVEYIQNSRGDVIDLFYEEIVITDYSYDAYGNHTATEIPFDPEPEAYLNPTAGSDNPFRYCGEYYDEETGFIYLRARYYDPSIGRFISEDSIRDGLNWYAYANNNPVMFVDPSGESWEYFDEYLPEWAQQEIERLTNEYYAAGESLNEYGGYVRDDIHAEAMRIRLMHLESKWLTYAINDFNDAGITEQNFNARVGENFSYFQFQYQYAMLLKQLESGSPLKAFGATFNRGLDGHLTEFCINNAYDAFIVGDVVTYSLKTMNNAMANKLVQKFGFKDAHEFKEYYVGKDNISKFNIKIDKKTGQIILESIKRGGSNS